MSAVSVPSFQIPSSPLPYASSCLHSKGSSLSSLVLLLLCFHSPLSLWLPFLTPTHSTHPYTGLYKHTHTHTQFISTSIVIHLPMSAVPGWHTPLSHRQSTDLHTTTLPNLPVFPHFTAFLLLRPIQSVSLSPPAVFYVFPSFQSLLLPSPQLYPSVPPSHSSLQQIHMYPSVSLPFSPCHI